MLKYIVLFISLLSVVCAQTSKYTVLKVYDGDTVTLKNSTTGAIFRVRVVCVDAPEMDQDPWGTKSQQRLLQLVPVNSEIKLNIIELDQYGRVLAELITPAGVNTAKQMLSEGLLVRYPYQRNCQSYDSYEKSAKAAKLGVWSDPTFVLPYEWRRTTLGPLFGRK